MKRLSKDWRDCPTLSLEVVKHEAAQEQKEAQSSISRRISTLGSTALYLAVVNCNSTWQWRDSNSDTKGLSAHEILTWLAMISHALLPFRSEITEAVSATTHSGYVTIGLWPVSGHGQRRNGIFESTYYWGGNHGEGKEQTWQSMNQCFKWKSKNGSKVSMCLRYSKKLGELCNSCWARMRIYLRSQKLSGCGVRTHSCASKEIWEHLLYNCDSLMKSMRQRRHSYNETSFIKEDNSQI